MRLISKDAKLTVCIDGHKNSPLTLWNNLTASLLGVFNSDTVLNSPIKFSPDDKLVACGASDLTVKLWDTATGK